MIMKLNQLYQVAVSNWPNKVSISDVCKVWDEIEEAVGTQNPWDELGVWVIYQCLSKQEKDNLESGIVSPEDIPIELFDYYMRENLGDVSWTSERADYIAANGGIIKEHLV